MQTAPQSSSTHVVIDFSLPSDEAWDELLRHIDNLHKDFESEGLSIEVVVYGDAIERVSRRIDDHSGGGIAQLIETGVTFDACQNAMRRAGLDEHDLLQGTVMVPSGIGRIVRAQREGAIYLKAS